MSKVRFIVEMDEISPLSQKQKETVASNIQAILQEVSGVTGFCESPEEDEEINDKLGIEVKVTVG